MTARLSPGRSWIQTAHGNGDLLLSTLTARALSGTFCSNSLGLSYMYTFTSSPGIPAGVSIFNLTRCPLRTIEPAELAHDLPKRLCNGNVLAYPLWQLVPYAWRGVATVYEDQGSPVTAMSDRTTCSSVTTRGTASRATPPSWARSS